MSLKIWWALCVPRNKTYSAISVSERFWEGKKRWEIVSTTEEIVSSSCSPSFRCNGIFGAFRLPFTTEQ